MSGTVGPLVVRLIADDQGQDIIEYGLLVAAVVTGSVALFPSILSGLATLFGSWMPAFNGISEPDPPR
jgi:Flp pilus assembly pilin Flp